jgi:hypothetical protein
MGKIFEQEIYEQMNTKAFAKEVERLMHNRVYMYFLRTKQELYRYFDNHPITKEIKEGVGAQNRGTMNGYGDLFSFLGFKEGSDPIGQLRTSLGEHTRLGNAVFKKDGREYIISYEIIVDVPSINKENTLPWATGLSWTESIEDGLKNLGFFISKLGYGNSGGGFQLKKEIRQGKFQPEPYLSEVVDLYLSKYRDIAII